MKDLKEIESELEKLRQQVKHLEDLNAEFVSAVSHELKTPMAVIRESVAQVVEGLHGELKCEQKEFLEITLKGIDRLTSLITDLVRLSKLETGQITLKKENLDLVSLVREVLENYSVKCRQRNIELVKRFSKDSLFVSADPERVKEILNYLIASALRFTEKGLVEISVRDEGAAAECRVRDSGAGIAAQDLPRVFEKFEQFASVASSEEKGTGLELALAKRLVEMHGGEIRVESQAGQGTVIAFSIPK